MHKSSFDPVSTRSSKMSEKDMAIKVDVMLMVEESILRCASGPTRRDITEGPPPQINGTPKTEAVTDEDRPVITTGPPPQINQVPQKNGVTTDEEQQNGANGSNRKTDSSTSSEEHLINE
ncbi:hypothetical protein L3X38_023079 [Prunus dulcis]|uniref:Uncharacterized protein n=1 Tax=Prunus dulcis TaxID=3755 RepID=A0AAD4Z4X3_PRUDU|nr:hypothetical protein L3X38_023079 [Prunus dulcis]